MPEGDTIYRTARALEKALAGRVVTGFETGLAKLAAVEDQTSLVGRVVERVEARGKWCLMHFSGDLILVTHMLMSGSWHIYRTGAATGALAERWRLPRRAMRAVVTCGEMQAVAFNVPVAEFFTARQLERSSQIPKLGPDVLSGDFTVATGLEAMRSRRASHPEDEVGIVLLNQRVIAGLGNVYKSEVAFAAAVNPWRQIVTVTDREMEKLVEVAQRYMKANVADGGGPRGESGEGIVTYTGPRRTTGSMDSSDRLWVYGRQGQECRRCGAIIAMRKQGPQARSTYWCAACQPWVAAVGQSAAAPQGKTAKVGRRRIGC